MEGDRFAGQNESAYAILEEPVSKCSYKTRVVKILRL